MVYYGQTVYCRMGPILVGASRLEAPILA
jgi:hypothetical protein